MINDYQKRIILSPYVEDKGHNTESPDNSDKNYYKIHKVNEGLVLLNDLKPVYQRSPMGPECKTGTPVRAELKSEYGCGNIQT